MTRLCPEADQGFRHDPFPDDPWSWTRVVFREVAGFPGYIVGSDGSVWSRLRIGRRAVFGDSWRHLKPKLNKQTGYLYLTMRDGKGIVRYPTIHRLVLEAFVGPCPPGMEACHDPDRDPANNRLGNLRWDYRSANSEDSRRHGTMSRGSSRWNSKITEEDIPVILSLVREGRSHRSIAALYRVHAGTIGEIARGKNWRHAMGAS